jgi:hypothetical protein
MLHCIYTAKQYSFVWCVRLAVIQQAQGKDVMDVYIAASKEAA